MIDMLRYKIIGQSRHSHGICAHSQNRDINTMLVPLLVLMLLCGLDYTEGAAVPKIVNGTDASEGEFPFAVSIRYFDFHECGGSIIGSNWILTAAHCVYVDFLNESTVLHGTLYLQNGEEPRGYISEVLTGFRHENYVEFGGYDNDIGLLKLTSNLAFNQRTHPISLPMLDSTVSAWSPATLVGWGYSYTNGTVMDTLQKVNILVYSEEACRKVHQELFNSRGHVCAGVPGGGKGQCSGDSGGPLIVNNVQYGIVSWSVKPCAGEGSPGVFTRVSSYRKWIFENTGL